MSEKNVQPVLLILFSFFLMVILVPIKLERKKK